MSKKIVIVLGAGASRDCVNGTQMPFTKGYEPPLVSELFANRPTFNAILQKYPKTQGLATTIRRKLSTSKVSLESLFLEYTKSTNLILYKKYLEIPYYIQELIGEVSEHYVSKSSTNFDDLIDEIIKKNFDICFLTLNYDLFLEQALSRTYGEDIKSFDDYIHPSRPLLIKLHGSVNWGRRFVLKNISNFIEATNLTSNIDTALQAEIVLLKDYHESNRVVDGFYTYPAMILPLPDKNFICPSYHIDVAKQFLKDCTNFLFIGYKGVDDHIFKNLFSLVRDPKLVGVVSKTHPSSDNILKKLSLVNTNFNKAKKHSYDGGFVHFMTNNLEAFLSDLE